MFESPDELDPTVRAAYLARLGVEAEPPSAEALRMIGQRQAATTSTVRSGCCCVPWVTPCTGTSAVCRAVNRVRTQWATTWCPPSATCPRTAIRRASGTSTTALGDALHEPLPLVAGSYVQEPFRLTLERAGDHTWQLTHDPAGGFRTMAWATAPARPADFVAKHEWLSTSPDSGFVQVPMAERRDATGVDVMRGLVLARIGADAGTAEPITRRSEWFDTLADRFDLRFDATPPESRDRLWHALLSAHRAWESGQSRS